MSKYQPFRQKDADAFLRLYKKYLDYKYESMERIFRDLPTDAIERAFSGTNIHKREDELFISFGFNDIRKTKQELEFYYKLFLDNTLKENLAKLGAKINENKIGVRQ